MQALRHLWQKLVTIYCFVVFLIAAWLVAIPLMWVFRLMPGEASRWQWRYHVFLHRFFRFIALHIPTVQTILHNPTGEDFSRPAIIIANHQSHLDLLCLLMLSPRVVAVTNDWVWHSVVYGPVVRYLEYYPVSSGIDEGVSRLSGLAARGYSIIIFPEGTRSADGRLLRFHKGAFHLAAELGLDLLPVYLDGTGRVLPKNDFTLHAGTLTVAVGQRVSPQDTQFGTTSRQQAHAWREHYASVLSSLNPEGLT